MIIKNNIIKIYIVLVGVIIGTSCSKTIRSPFDSIDLAQSFRSVSDVKKWDIGLYSNLRGSIYGEFTTTTDIQADLLTPTTDYGNRGGFPYAWSTFLSTDYTISGVWQQYYYGIANANEMIDGATLVQPQTAADSASLNQYLGDAYLVRAFYYQELVLRWAKPYNAASASTDLGVPILLKYDVTAMPARATISDVYTQILADESKAKQLLTNVSGSVGSNVFTVDAAIALEARTKFYMEDWAGAQADALILIQSPKYPLVTTQADLTAMWANDTKDESIVQLYGSLVEHPLSNGIYQQYRLDVHAYDPDWVPAQWVVDMYDNSDFRKAAYFQNTTVYIGGQKYSNIYVINKYPGNPSINADSTTSYNMPKLFRIAEMYLISAESQVSGNPSGALATLNQLRNSRGLISLNGLTGNALLDSIKNERFRELAFEGFRLDDLKRWGEGFTRHDPQNTAILNTTYITLSKDAGDDKFQWGIPSNDILVNPSLKGEQNPGW